MDPIARSAIVFCSAALLLVSFPQNLPGKDEVQPALKLNFAISQTCGLLHLMAELAKESEEKSAYYDFLLAHHKLDKHDKFRIRQFQRFCKSNAEYKASSGRKLSLQEKLLVTACNSKTIEEFFKSARTFCDENVFSELEQLVGHFRAIYEQLVWKPFSPQLNRNLAAYRSKETEFALPLTALCKFFRCSMFFKQALKVTLLPVPVEVKAEGNAFIFKSSAFSQNLDEVVIKSEEIIPPETIASMDDKRVSNNSDLSAETSSELTAELTRCIWSYALPEFRESLERSLAAKGPQFNYDLLGESQAAAVESWFFKEQSGKEKKEGWHENEYVDKYARAILPIILEYADLKNGSAKDVSAEAYADKLSEVFFQTFPDWQKDPQIILWKSQIIQAPLSSTELATEIDKEVFGFKEGAHKISTVKGETWPLRYLNYAKHPELSSIFMIHPGQLDILEKYFHLDSQLIAGLKTELKASGDGQGPLVKAVKTEKSWLVFVIASKQTEQKEALLKYASSGN